MNDSDKRKNNNLSAVNNVVDSRLYIVLDSISDRLVNIENQLTEVVRLQERVNNHEQVLSRYGQRLDSHEIRIRESELWQAHHGDRGSTERLVTNVQEELDKLKKSINISAGQSDVSKAVLKWFAALAAAFIIYLLNSMG